MIFCRATVQPPSLKILCAAANVAELLRLSMTVTVGREGQHMPGSMHGLDRALDVRSHNLTAGQKTQFLHLVRGRLGPDYDCLLEAEGTANEHFHLEYDPEPAVTRRV